MIPNSLNFFFLNQTYTWKNASFKLRVKPAICSIPNFIKHSFKHALILIIFFWHSHFKKGYQPSMKSKEVTELIRTLLINDFPQEKRDYQHLQLTHSSSYYSITSNSAIPSYLHGRPYPAIQKMLNEKRKAEALIFEQDVLGVFA